jgi:hypothetical protein
MSEENSSGTEIKNETEVLEKTESKAKKEPKTEDIEAIREVLRKEMEAVVSEKVRKEEKDKLYPEIERLKASLKERDTSLEDALKAVKEYEDKNLSAEEKTNKLLQELVNTNDTLKTQLESVRQEAESRVRNLQLASFKDKLISSYSGKIVEGLVSGEDEESITSSAIKAHEKWVEIAESVAKMQLDEKQKTALGTSIDPATDKKVTGINIGDIDNIKDPNEWAKVRADILAKAGILTK